MLGRRKQGIKEEIFGLSSQVDGGAIDWDEEDERQKKTGMGMWGWLGHQEYCFAWLSFRDPLDSQVEISNRKLARMGAQWAR